MSTLLYPSIATLYFGRPAALNPFSTRESAPTKSSPKVEINSKAMLSAIDPGTLEALYVFAIAGILVALALVCAGLMTRRKDHKAAHFYFIEAVVAGGVAFLLIALALIFGGNSQ